MLKWETGLLRILKEHWPTIQSAILNALMLGPSYANGWPSTSHDQVNVVSLTDEPVKPWLQRGETKSVHKLEADTTSISVHPETIKQTTGGIKNKRKSFVIIEDAVAGDYYQDVKFSS